MLTLALPSSLLLVGLRLLLATGIELFLTFLFACGFNLQILNGQMNDLASESGLFLRLRRCGEVS